MECKETRCNYFNDYLKIKIEKFKVKCWKTLHVFSRSNEGTLASYKSKSVFFSVYKGKATHITFCLVSFENKFLCLCSQTSTSILFSLLWQAFPSSVTSPDCWFYLLSWFQSPCMSNSHMCLLTTSISYTSAFFLSLLLSYSTLKICH